jgi:hypothetical protein
MSEKKTKAQLAEENFGIKNRRHLRRAQYVTTFLTVVLVSILFYNVKGIQGNARIINYSGMVRGSTQRLVKEELQGHPDDVLVSQIDDILYSLQTGSGKYQVAQLEDDGYNAALDQQAAAWTELKTEIEKYRTSSSEKDTLYQMSEDYYTTADATVSMAQDYSERIEQRFTVLEVLLVIVMAVNILLLLGYYIELSKATHHNIKLSDMAYIDALTGLANKRKCRERLADKEPISSSTSVACFMFDLNYLKKVNDESGHEAGDKLIHTFAQILKEEAIPHMFLGRFGGMSSSGSVSMPQKKNFPLSNKDCAPDAAKR